MGNSQHPHIINPGIKDFIQEQFQRLRTNQSQNHLVLSQIIQANHPDDFPFDFKHLGILFICDQNLDGIFTLKDLEYFALWTQINIPLQKYEFKAHLQAKTVTKMIQILQKRDGQNTLITWFMKMLVEGNRKKKLHGQTYLTIDCLKTVYEIFNVQVMSDMDIQSFFYLMKKSSEDMGYQIQNVVEHEEQQQYIALPVCEEFIKNFIKGILKILKDIGYNTTTI